LFKALTQTLTTFQFSIMNALKARIYVAISDTLITVHG
jgi:hypothetical protein